MKIGDKVKSIGFWAGLEDVVTAISPGTDIVNHGFVEVEITEISDTYPNCIYHKIGEFERFVHFNWKFQLQIIDEN